MTFAIRKEHLGQCAPETSTNHCQYTTSGLTWDGMVIEWMWEDRLVQIVDTAGILKIAGKLRNKSQISNIQMPIFWTYTGVFFNMLGSFLARCLLDWFNIELDHLMHRTLWQWVVTHISSTALPLFLQFHCIQWSCPAPRTNKPIFRTQKTGPSFAPSL